MSNIIFPELVKKQTQNINLGFQPGNLHYFTIQKDLFRSNITLSQKSHYVNYRQNIYLFTWMITCFIVTIDAFSSKLLSIIFSIIVLLRRRQIQS